MTSDLTQSAASAWLRLIRAPGLSRADACALLQHSSSPEAALDTDAGVLRSLALGAGVAEALRAAAQLDVGADLAWLARPDHHLVPFLAAAYPPLLGLIPDPPLALFVRGDPAVLTLPALAIVGSRNPTSVGRETSEAFAAHLAQGGLSIVSGLALGIDAAAHRGALAGGGTTVAVCGTGLDGVYPAANEELAAAIVRAGALVSEYPVGTAPRRQNFPRRNRIISGLSLGTLVVEAALRSGSLITAHAALEQGREVFAVPGSIHNPLARGCHRLIREGAKLIESAHDIVSELGALAGLALIETQERPLPVTAADEDDPDYRKLLEALAFAPARVDELVGRSGLTAEAVSSMLVILELQGRVERAPGGAYLRSAALGHDR